MHNSWHVGFTGTYVILSKYRCHCHNQGKSMHVLLYNRGAPYIFLQNVRQWPLTYTVTSRVNLQNYSMDLPTYQKSSKYNDASEKAFCCVSIGCQLCLRQIAKPQSYFLRVKKMIRPRKITETPRVSIKRRTFEWLIGARDYD